MNFKFYRDSVSNLFAQNKMLKFAFIVLLILQIYTQYSLIKISNIQTVIVIPKGLDKTVTLAGGEFDDAYLNAMGSYIAQLYWSFEPATAVGQYQQLVTLYSPLTGPAAKPDLFALSESYKFNNVSMSFIITDVSIELQPEQRILLKGWRKKYILKNLVEETVKTLEIKYTARNGKFQIKSISEQ